MLLDLPGIIWSIQGGCEIDVLAKMVIQLQSKNVSATILRWNFGDLKLREKITLNQISFILDHHYYAISTLLSTRHGALAMFIERLIMSGTAQVLF